MVAQIIQNQIEKIEYREKQIFWSLFATFAFLIVSYGFLLNSTMMNAVSKQQMEKEMTTLSSNINTQEFKYLSLKDGITLQLAESKGFVAISADKFAVINPSQKNLSLSINEN